MPFTWLILLNKTFIALSVLFKLIFVDPNNYLDLSTQESIISSLFYPEHHPPPWKNSIITFGSPYLI
jgi:hypothetical protein